MCRACADTHRDVGEIRPVSVQLHVQAVSVDCTVAPSADVHHSCVALHINTRSKSVLTHTRTVRSCNRNSPAAQTRCEATNFCLDFARARGNAGRCCASSLEYACVTFVMCLRNAEAVHIPGRLSTGGNAGWCYSSSPDTCWTRLSIGHNAGRGYVSSPKHVFRYISRAACRQEATLVSLSQLAQVHLRIHGWLST